MRACRAVQCTHPSSLHAVGVPERCPRAQVGAEIVKRALGYPLKLIASNAGVNGSVVMQKVMDQADKNVGYNAATGAYEDLMAAGIIDPTKVAPNTPLPHVEFLI